MMDIASTVRFSELSGLLERIFKSKKISEKQSLLNDFVSNWREFSSSHVIRDDSSFYPVMRLIMPIMDKYRASYGIKEHILAKFYCSILCLGPDHPEHKKLMNFKTHCFSEKKHMDFAEVVYNILKNRSPNKGAVTIEEINKRLDKLSEASGRLKNEIINENLTSLFDNSSALDQKWLIRIILKDLSIGLSSKAIFKCFHPLSEEYYNVTSDLKSVCEKFKSLTETIQSFDIEIFKPFKPMLSKRGDIQNVLTQIDNQSFIHEIKFDGERVQLHKSGSTYRYWSRNSLEWSASYGVNPCSGTLTPFIHDQFKPDVNNCILDGEMMGYNVATKTMGSKTDEFDIKNPNIEKSGYLPCFIVFDILYLNNKVLTHETLLNRKKILDTQILKSELEGKIQISKWTEATTREECLEAFNIAIENCEEGIMVKRIESIYKVNSRVGGWFKMKPDYVLGLHEEIDCVIVGGYFGFGQLIRHFLCAVKSEAFPNRYFSFTKLGSGFTRKTIYEFNLKMAPHWKICRKENLPDFLKLSEKGKEIPDVYIDPENSYIVQLKAAEIIASENYATNSTLRFGRIDKFREDKSPTMDCMTVEEVQQLRFAHKGKLALHSLEINSDDEEISMQTEKKKQKRVTKRISVAETFKSTVPIKKSNTSDCSNLIFSGKELCILLGNTPIKDCNKKQLETFVFVNGGNVVQNPGRSTFAVIANCATVKIQNLMKTNLYDIISTDWMLECVKQKAFVPLKPTDFLSMKTKTAKLYEGLYDTAGDSYTNEISIDLFKKLLQDMDSKLLSVPDLSVIAKSRFIDEMMMDDLDLIFLNGCVIYFLLDSECDYSVSKLSEIERIQCLAKLAGAIISDNVEQLTISHVILIDPVLDIKLNHLHSINRQRTHKFYLVTLKWIIDSLHSNMRLTECLYFNK